MSAEIFYVRRGKLYKPDGSVVCAVGRRTGWIDWLRDMRHKSFRYESFEGPQCSVVRESRKSPSSGIVHWYWYAHRKIGGRPRRKYLGKSEKLTITALEAAARSLAQLGLDDAAEVSQQGA